MRITFDFDCFTDKTSAHRKDHSFEIIRHHTIETGRLAEPA